jgi:heme/copper-type cytochrome/quinol oxidase subunit 2
MMADQSLDLKNTARSVKNRMWWKNKKVMIGIIVIVLILIGIIIWLIAK